MFQHIESVLFVLRKAKMDQEEIDFERKKRKELCVASLRLDLLLAGPHAR